MHHVSEFGYLTPPASPASFDQQCIFPPPHQLQQHHYVPMPAEDRLGMFITNSLQLSGILGSGAYGVVYSAVDLKDNVRYAVKCLSKFNPDGTPLDARQITFQRQEIRLHHQASGHPNVVSMVKIIEQHDCIYVVLEYCPEGDLFYNITERGQYVGKDELAKSVFLQILDAVGHCHSRGIYHRDLKPENILVSDNGETVKLADFGLAIQQATSMDYGCGSTFYMSPECLDQTARRPFYYCAPNDVWSLGVILVNLTCGRNPWKQASFEDSTYRAYVKSKDFLKTILPVSDELNDILARIFTPNPDHRITLPELRSRIFACSRFTQSPASLEQQVTYVDAEEYLLPSSSNSLSDEGSTCSSDDGSLTSGCSSIEDLEEDDDDDLVSDIPEIRTPPPQQPLQGREPVIFEALEAPNVMTQYKHDYFQQPYPSTVPQPVQQPTMPISVQPNYAPSKYPSGTLWETIKYYTHSNHAPFHQVPFFSHIQGCY
ncbi:kinase-like domain-containing protein [Pseudoneurospora amorphoporcata]|uniref:Kinase-like domain-containing protein n=1 Tax=Pseudoneurospora amorphoporcata TaxID=241081 RepID=A0AAN6NLK3_9PEZI|nr:kinase-like domain-containing protein [Pseudoneurospora amorphoporcata]